MSDFLDKQIQKKIYMIITKNPGIHISKISELINIPLTIVKTHLQILVISDTIYFTEDDGFKRYFTIRGKRKDIDNNLIETRQKIYDLVLKNPGLHQAKIAQMLEMRKSLAEYHLKYLEKNNAIISVKEDGYKRYYTEESEVDVEGKKVIALVRQETPRNIILLLLKNPILKHKEIAEKLGISPSTLSYHLNKLMDQYIIDVKKYGDDKGYVIKSRNELLKMLIKYEVHSIIDSFEDIWDDIY